MQESVTYQAILAEGIAEGRAEEVRRVAMNLLKEGMSVEIVAKVTGLSVEQVQQLGSEEAGNVGD
jgi:predicted transposase/invertase (TIGR01784 family)